MKFLHLRYHWVSDKITQPDELIAKGGVTVAYEAADNVVKYALAQCHYRDTFCKRLGRDISQGRFLAGKTKRLVLGESTMPRDAVREDVYRMLSTVTGINLQNQLY